MTHPMQELMNKKIWICWNYKTVKGKKTKVPCSANGGATGTSKNYSFTWVTYEEAMAAKANNKFSGIGFIIPEGYFFLDIDEKDLQDPIVQRFLKRFSSYTEYSVSDTGLHTYGKCDIKQLPTYLDKAGIIRLEKKFLMKNSKLDLELYIGGLTNRFAVFTGKTIVDKPLEDCTPAILETLNKEMLRTVPKETAALPCSKCDVDSVIKHLKSDRNHDKFIRLFDKGDLTGYGSQSEADLALCTIVAFRTGNNPEAIDSIFRMSALMRDKWDREDYRDRTIEKAIEGCHGVFHYSVKPRPEFVKYQPESGKEIVLPTILARHIRNDLHYIFVRDNGRQGVLRYVYENGCYRYYSDDMLLGLIKQYIVAYNEDIVKMSSVKETFGLLTSDLNYVNYDELNSDEDIINFENGILRLSDMALLPHSPDYLSTIQIPCKWLNEAKPTPVFDRYMKTLTNDDTQVENLLYEFCGTGLSNIKGYRMKKALFMVGNGDTGKSQLKSLEEHLLGKGNFVSIDLSEIEARFGTSNIHCKRLAGSSDMSFMTVSELKTFKKCTGGDSLFAEFKGMNGFEFTYGGLLWFCMNRLPKFGGDDGKWVYDRIMHVECTNVIPKEKQDKYLLEKMYEEREGIVYKFIMALKTMIGNGYRYSEPESVVQARKQYMEDNNTVIGFYNECMTERVNNKFDNYYTTGKIFNVYRAWCRDNNHGFAKTAKEFRTILAEHLGTTFPEMTVRRGQGGTFYRTLTLTDEVKVLYSNIHVPSSEDDGFLA